MAPVVLDAEFERRFNDELEWSFRYNFYYDHPGNFDLVARREGRVLIVDAKGRSATNRRGAIAQMIGNLSLARDPSKSERRYAILLPEGAAWDKAMRNHGGLDWLEVPHRRRETGGDPTGFMGGVRTRREGEVAIAAVEAGAAVPQEVSLTDKQRTHAVLGFIASTRFAVGRDRGATR